MTTLEAKVQVVINRVAKWRAHFAGWQLGTRSTDDPEAQAIRDHRETTLLLRIEVNAFTALLLEKKVFTVEEFQQQLIKEAEWADEQFKKRWPGAEATDTGMKYDNRCQSWMSKWKK